jgi:hypothetical protein
MFSSTSASITGYPVPTGGTWAVVAWLLSPAPAVEKFRVEPCAGCQPPKKSGLSDTVAVADALNVSFEDAFRLSLPESTFTSVANWMLPADAVPPKVKRRVSDLPDFSSPKLHVTAAPLPEHPPGAEASTAPGALPLRRTCVNVAGPLFLKNTSKAAD